MNQVRILFFATLRDRAGVHSVNLEIPAEATIAVLKRQLAEQYPALKDLVGRSIFAVNREYVFDPVIIPDGAEIALFPPVSGG